MKLPKSAQNRACHGTSITGFFGILVRVLIEAAAADAIASHDKRLYVQTQMYRLTAR
jgi:hypothetical protein